MKVIKKLTPHHGLAMSPVDILKQARQTLDADGMWVQGSIACPTPEFINKIDHEVDEGGRTDTDAYDIIANNILRNGLCGQGWGMCAMGALSYEAGLHAVIEEPRFNHFTGDSTTRKRIVALVDEQGEINYGETRGVIPAVRVKRYKKAGQALDAAAQELFDSPTIVQVNDDENWVGDEQHPEMALKNVLACFDRAIETLEGAK